MKKTTLSTKRLRTLLVLLGLFLLVVPSAFAAPNSYSAPVLESVTAAGGDFILEWSLPASGYGTPAGGYDLVIDGVDQNDHIFDRTAEIAGLSSGEHCFQVEARWTQGGSYPRSNEVCASPAPAQYTTPVLERVRPSDSDLQLTWSLPATAYGSPEGGYDLIIDGVDQNDHIFGQTATIAALPAGEHCFQVEVRWTQAGHFLRSNELCIDTTPASGQAPAPVPAPEPAPVPEPAPAEFTAPALDSVQASGGNFLINWSQPSNSSGIPEGGYDLIIDGVDQNNHTLDQFATISGLSSGEHCFEVEARWTQASPAQFLRSGQMCATLDVVSAPQPSVPAPKPGELLAFPGAEGHGRFIQAGRGGRVIKVTNLNDSGAGSFRAAVEDSGARIVVFEVGGEINLKSPLQIYNPYLTIAGQTAPAPGVTVSGYGFKIFTHDILMQHLFVRHTVQDGADAIDCDRSGSTVPYNIVIDHCSVSWGNDEVMSFAPGGTNTRDNNSTFSNNLIAEGTGSRYGTLISDGTKKLSVIKNLWVSNYERQPRVKGGVTASLVNNVSYNVGTAYSTVIGSAIGANHLNLIGNLHLDGPNTPSTSTQFGAAGDIVSGSMIYDADNVSTDNQYNSRATSYLVNSPCVALDGVAILNSSQVEDYVLGNVGARPGERDGVINNGWGDPVDERLIDEVKTGKGSLKSSPPALPARPKATRPFQVPANPGGDDDGDGYTNIEEILHQMAAEVEGH